MGTYPRDLEWYMESQTIYHDPLKFEPAPVSFIEIWNYPDGDSQILEGSLEQTEIKMWVSKDAPRLVKDGQQMDPINGIRLCIENRKHKQRWMYTWSWNKENLLAIMSDFRLPSAFLQPSLHTRGRFSMLSGQELAGRGSDLDLGFIITPRADALTEIELAFSWNNTTRATCGILRISNQTLLDQYLRELKSLRHLASQPLVLGLVLLEAILIIIPEWLSLAERDIAAVQSRTGHLGGITLDHVSLRGPLDYDQVSLEVSRIGQVVSWYRDLYKSYLYLCEFISQSATRSKLVEDRNIPPASAANWEVFSALLNANKSQIIHDLNDIDYYKEMCIIQNQNVYNLIAQRDVQQNIELARDSKSIAAASKRDSSAMKSIALLTMVILPGTFISTLFAIPLFNWDAESWRDVPKSRFWFYWALTLPLTILTVAAWLAWQKVYERTGRSLDKAAREEVPNSKIPDAQTRGASSSSSEQGEMEQHNISEGLRMRKRDRIDRLLPWHKRSTRHTETNQGESPV